MLLGFGSLHFIQYDKNLIYKHCSPQLMANQEECNDEFHLWSIKIFKTFKG